MDVGGTLTKIVYFEADLANQAGSDRTIIQRNNVMEQEPKSLSRSNSLVKLDAPDHQLALHELYENMSRFQRQSATAAFRDDSLSFYSSILGGSLHFMHFETRNMVSTVHLLSSTAITDNIRTIGCTGGGSVKYASIMEEELGITLHQLDELSSLIKGMHFALTNVIGECYTYRSASTTKIDSVSESTQEAVANSPIALPISPVNSSVTDKPTTSEHPNFSISMPSSSSESHACNEDKPVESRTETSGSGIGGATPLFEKRWRRDIKENTQKVTIPYATFASGQQFPYLVVNVGSGVSILKVSAPGEFERVSGTSLGGGTYWGLCRLLLSKCTSYEEVLDLAEAGDATEIDMLVKDIYGGGYDAMNLSGSMVASSFGKLVMKERPREGIKEEDIAIALLMMITNNIGQVAYLNAQLHNCKTIFFVGSFMRHNPISCRRLAFAIDFWSKGNMEALFLTHEGYFGALGTFLDSAFGESLGRVLSWSQEHGEAEGRPRPYDGDVEEDSRGGKKRGSTSKKSRDGRTNPRTRGRSGYDQSNSLNQSQKQKQSREHEQARTESKKGLSIYGLDVDILQRIRDWRPKPFKAFKRLQRTLGGRLDKDDDDDDDESDDDYNNDCDNDDDDINDDGNEEGTGGFGHHHPVSFDDDDDSNSKQGTTSVPVIVAVGSDRKYRDRPTRIQRKRSGTDIGGHASDGDGGRAESTSASRGSSLRPSSPRYIHSRDGGPGAAAAAGGTSSSGEALSSSTDLAEDGPGASVGVDKKLYRYNSHGDVLRVGDTSQRSRDGTSPARLKTGSLDIVTSHSVGSTPAASPHVVIGGLSRAGPQERGSLSIEEVLAWTEQQQQQAPG